MKKILVLPILWAFAFSFSAQAAVTDLPFFQGSMSQLQEMARQSRVPYMVYFYVLECDPCRKMQKESFNHEPLIRYAEESYLLYRVDGLDFLSGIDIAKKYGVRSYPTTIIFGPDGDVRKREEGFISGAELTRMLMKNQKVGDRRPDSRMAVTTSNIAEQPVAKNSPPVSATSPPVTTSQLPGWAKNNQKSKDNPLYNSSLAESNSWESSNTSPQIGQAGVDKRDYVSEYLNYRANSPENAVSYDTWRNQTENTRGNSPQGGPGYVNPYGSNDYNNGGQGTSPAINSSGNSDASFLAPVDMAQAGQGGLPEYVWDGNRQVARGTLPASTQLYRGADGQWHVSRTTTAEGTNMRTRGAAPEQPTETIYAVPGFGDYAPKKLKSETFGLLVGEYDAITTAKAGLKEFQENNPGIPVWVYAERKGSSTIYKMAMGVYSTPDAATTDAMARGADWEEIRVVQLNQ